MPCPESGMKFRRIIIATGAAVVIALGAMEFDVQLHYIKKLAPSAAVTPAAPVAMVLGASVNDDGTPSDALRDRLLIGQELYATGKVSRILLTGDDGEFRRDEIDVMKAFLISKGVPAWDILEDGRGFRTYESCKRASQVFHFNKVIVVTQRFHIGRALYLCNRLGVDAHGVSSDLQNYRRNPYFWARDLAASIKAWWDINVWPPRPPV